MRHPNAKGQGAGGGCLQQLAILVIGPAAHCLAQVKVFCHRVGSEAFRDNDGDFAAGQLIFDGLRAVGSLLLGHDAFDAAVVIDVRVGDNHRFNRPGAQVFFHQRHGGLRALDAHHHIK